MTLKQSYDQIHRALDAPLAELFFRREGEGHYSCAVADGVSHHARFPARRATDGSVLFTLCVSAHFDALERLLPSAAVMVPIHLLQPSRDYYEWPVRASNDFAAVASSIVTDFRQWALPFFAAHRDLRTLREHVSVHPPRYSYAFGPVQCACLLAAIDHLLGHTAAVLRRLERLANENHGFPPKKWLPYKQLHDAISATTGSA
jgi:hypothetical protein